MKYIESNKTVMTELLIELLEDFLIFDKSYDIVKNKISIEYNEDYSMAHLKIKDYPKLSYININISNIDISKHVLPK